MKLVLLFYVEGDGPAVTRLLSAQGIHTYTRLPVEGHGEGNSGSWYGSIAPNVSKMLLTVVGDEQASTLVEAVRSAPVQSPGHPIHAAVVGLEGWVHSVSLEG